MQRMGKMLVLALVGAAVVLLLGSWAQAEVGKTPTWDLYENGKPVKWKAHKDNPRFAIYDPKGNNNSADPATLSDDVVLDRETGLIWVRYVFADEKKWSEASQDARRLSIANHKGFRLPTIDEINTLLYPEATDGLYLPPGHPFIVESGLVYVWSDTTDQERSDTATGINFLNGNQFWGAKSGASSCMWPVRGGNPYATGSW